MRFAAPAVTCICFLATWLFAQKSPQEGMFEVSGQVVALDTGQPLDRIDVSIADTAVGDRQWHAVTQANGQFRFLVPQGKYRLSGERNGIPRQVFGQGAYGFGSSVIVGHNSTAGLRFEMYLPAAIRGTVLDEAGESAENALVQLVKAEVIAGERRMVALATAYADDRGQYRFAGLTPGKYYVGASGRPWYSADLKANGDSNLAHKCFAPVFYANATLPNAATPITLKSGEEFVADMSVTAVPGTDVTLAPADSAEEAGSLERIQYAVRRQVAKSSPWVQYAGWWDASTVTSVPYGDYRLEAFGLRNGTPVYDLVLLDADSPEAEVELSLKPAPAVTGTLKGDLGDHFSHLQVKLLLVDFEGRRSSPTLIRGTGPFAFPVTSPGTYALMLRDAPGFYINRLTIDGVDQRSLDLEIQADHAPKLVIQLSPEAGRIEGLVLARGKPAPGTLVVLEPKSGEVNGFRSAAFETDSDGSFSFDSIPPGEYVLVTSADTELEYANPAVIKRLEATGVLITVGKRSRLKMDLQLSSP